MAARTEEICMYMQNATKIAYFFRMDCIQVRVLSVYVTNSISCMWCLQGLGCIKHQDMMNGMASSQFCDFSAAKKVKKLKEYLRCSAQRIFITFFAFLPDWMQQQMQSSFVLELRKLQANNVFWNSISEVFRDDKLHALPWKGRELCSEKNQSLHLTQELVVFAF